MCKQQDPNTADADAATAPAAAASKAKEATYLVIGAGTAGLSFIDSILTLDASATVILVDRNSQPGGHWTKSYPFVRLHQSSCNYGVNSLPLSNIRDKKGNEPFDVHDLASGQQVCEYYTAVVEQFRTCGRVHIYFNCEYSKDDSGNHLVTNIDTNVVTRVSCKKLVVVHSNVLVPSMRNSSPFPIDSSINYAPLNELPARVASNQFKKYVVIGAGKTGSDAITYLLRSGVDQSAIKWITSRDIWYLVRDGLWGGYKTYRKDTMKLVDPLVKCKTLLDAFLQYEKDGIMARIDTSTLPEVFKGATISKSELAGFKSIKDIVRLGRVTSITSDEIKLEKGTVPLPAPPADTLFVDCMADLDGSVYGYRIPKDFKIFDDNQINLGPSVVSFNFSCSSAVIAYIESVFEDDSEMRNNLLYFAKGGDFTTDYTLFFSQFYHQNKVFSALGAYPPVMQFIMNSRTYLDAPSHHYLGMAGFLWALFGPSQMAKKAAKFVERVESGDFPETQNCFGCAGRKLPEPKELKIKVKSNLKSNYPPQKKSKSKSKLRLNCCATVDVIEGKRGVDYKAAKAAA